MHSIAKRLIGWEDVACAYESAILHHSKVLSGVSFTIRRISFANRIDLSRKVRDLSRRFDFFSASNNVQSQVEANVLAQEIDEAYLKWGLIKVEGLSIDGKVATPESLLENGPEELVDEIASAIQAELGLTEEERKNS